MNEEYEKRGLQNKAVIVDCNHSNSAKDFSQQPRIAMDVLGSMKASPDVKNLVKGLMIESYLVDGAQPIGGSVYGQSITDACLGWEKSERLILEIAQQL